MLFVNMKDGLNALEDEILHQADILQSLGIDGINETVIKEVMESLKGMLEMDIPVNSGKLDVGTINITATLLSRVGYGKLNPQSGKLSPISNSVYSFDGEVDNLEEKYKVFCLAVMHISQYEITFSEIVEEREEQDDLEPETLHRISFKYNGTKYYYEEVFHDDWFNGDFINFINDIFEKENNLKRLYLLSGGMYGVIVFYQTSKWAEKFRELTSLSLDTKISES